MGTLRGSNASPPRKKWQRVFDNLVHMLQTQARERELLEERIQLLVDQYQYQISQMMSDLKDAENLRKVVAAKADLEVGHEKREAFSYKLKLDDRASELEDVKVMFDYLSCKCSETKENSSKMVALLSERNFVWNQYKKRETDLTDRLKSKSTEAEQANEKIQKLLASMERLQSSNTEKDSMILKLKTNMAELKAASGKKGEEISRLSRELELLRKARSNSVTPVLHRCSGKAQVGDKNESNDARNMNLKKESYPSRVTEKGVRSSKRKAVNDAIPISETPKLFTSTFKVPKLKISSPTVI